MNPITASDLECRCGECGPREMGYTDTALEALNDLQQDFGAELQINSGWRCRQHPEERSKTWPGSHTTADDDNVTVDVGIYGRDAYKLLELAMRQGFTGIGIKQINDYSSRFLHLDKLTPPGTVRSPRPWVWTYR